MPAVYRSSRFLQTIGIIIWLLEILACGLLKTYIYIYINILHHTFVISDFTLKGSDPAKGKSSRQRRRKP
nr:PREDICTED: uncharacterized protein LOC105663847 isoform X2 [Megachile rotundata]